MNSIGIIGGGITGLTAAFKLRQAGLNVTVYEAASRVGGVIQSVREQGYLAETGPNTILETSPQITELVNELGLAGRRIESDPRANNRYIVRNGKPVALPDSLVGFCRTPLFSARAKLRLLAEPFIPPAPKEREENLAQFVRRRLGQEFLDYAINPFVAGVYAGSPDRLSVAQAFPKLHALEQRYGSLIRGQIFGARERRRRAEVSKQNAKKFSFDFGLQVLIDQLEERLTSDIRLNSTVVRVEEAETGWRLTTSTHGEFETCEHSAVLYCSPSFRLGQIEFQTRQPIPARELVEIHYPPVISIALGFARADVAHPLDGFGALVPEVEGFNILGSIFSSSLFPNRAPEGHVLLTNYLGGVRHPELAERSDSELVEMTLCDLRRILGVTGRPAYVHIARFAHAIPQYEVGYGVFKEAMDQIEIKAPGFFLAGPYRNGISLGDSIVAGRQAAERLARYVTTRVPVANCLESLNA